MKPKDKAKELVNKFFPDLKSITEMGFSHVRKEYAIKCALICVDEIRAEISSFKTIFQISIYGESQKYWNEVKQEIQKL